MTPELVTAIGGVILGLAGAVCSFLIAIRRLESAELRAQNRKLRRRVGRLERENRGLREAALDVAQKREAQ